MDKITPENGVCQCSYKSKKVAYYYTPWLSDAIKLICFTGRRRKDIFGAKFSDIIENNDGIPVVLNMGNTKVELKKKKRKLLIQLAFSLNFVNLYLKLVMRNTRVLIVS